MASLPPPSEPSGPRAPAPPPVSDSPALPPGTRLGEFELMEVLGVGGFGIVYRAMDHALGREVAVKEYMPSALADRTETLHVSLRSQASADTFALGLRSFVNEARLLARFDHPSLVKVYRFWEQHNTAYMVMPLYRGRTLKQLREAGEAPCDEASLRKLLASLLGALERLHDDGVYHRDISPDNILIEPDGRPVLLDFGAARHVIADRSQNLTAILKPSYAPIEQYAEAEGVRQGAWTDLYALGATMHFLLRGVAPPPSTVRTLSDPMRPLADESFAGVSRGFLAAIDWMLDPRPHVRPGSVAALRQVLSGRAEVPPRPRGTGADPDATVVVAPAAPAAPLAPEVAVPDARSAPMAPPSAATAPRGAPAPADEARTVVLPRPAPPPTVAEVLASAAPAAPPVPPARQPAGRDAPAASLPKSRWTVGVAIAGYAAVGLAAAWWFFSRPPASAPVAPPVTQAPAAPSPAPAPVQAQVPAATDATQGASAPVIQTAAPVAPAPEPAVSTGPVPAAVRAAPAGAVAAPAVAAVPRPAPRPAAAAPTRPNGGADGASAMPAAATAVSPPPPVQPYSSTPATARPAPAAPAPTAAAVPAPAVAGPNQRCGTRVLIARWNCMNRECSAPELLNHPECKAWKESTEWHRGPQQQ